MNECNLSDDLEFTGKILSRVPGSITWQDRQSKFLCANNSSLEHMGFKTFSEMYDKTPGDMNNGLVELSEELVKNNNYIIENNCITTTIFSSYAASGEWGLHLVQQQPLLDKDNKIIGVSSIASDIRNTSLATKLIHLFLGDTSEKSKFKLSQGLYRYNSAYKDLKLSKRQGECFFWLLRRKTANEIAQILGLNKRTVEAYIVDVRAKFNAKTTMELMDMAEAQGFDSYMPKHWLEG